MFDFLKSAFTSSNIKTTIKNIVSSILIDETVLKQINLFFFSKVNEVIKSNNVDLDKIKKISEIASMGVESLILTISVLELFRESNDLDKVLKSEEYQKLYCYANQIKTNTNLDSEFLKSKL